eukprot:gnl/TRDRNA2_/TRDRNA2_43245_c0_seq1.p1 gnl/TRDRNA2_/TRDRNA2_43245_c0~~gnl/TRDRNA2_/TRDRNA2_43245_c0_seq1.p1  ORF type:complete len:385 (-),score=69.65 gnl/TRDRNA2_/TRDRNA2_43245_c0_seq1:111-1265(-)
MAMVGSPYPMGMRPNNGPPGVQDGMDTKSMVPAPGCLPSVAMNMQMGVVGIRAVRPCPATKQYANRGQSRIVEAHMQPRTGCDICGYAQASIEPEPHNTMFSFVDKVPGYYDYVQDPSFDGNMMDINHNEDRMVYLCISGWALMMWQSQEAFAQGISGARRAPRPLAWWDLRKAYDVIVNTGDLEIDRCPHRITLLMNGGKVSFRVELTEDVPVWFRALRRVIQDWSIQFVRSRDSEFHRNRRWQVALSICEQIMAGSYVSEEALDAVFKAYDIDYDNNLAIGEFMLLIQELLGAKLRHQGRAEAIGSSAEALEAAAKYMTEDELFERAYRFRKMCDVNCDGKVRKEEFICRGQNGMSMALDMGIQLEDHECPGGSGGEVCSVM